VAKLVAMGPRSADIVIGGKKATLQLETASWLVSEALNQNKQNVATQRKRASLPGADIK